MLAAVWDPSNVATAVSEFFQSICGPTEFIGEVDDGSASDALGLRTVGKAFNNSAGTWAKKGDGSVTIVFHSEDTEDVTVNVMSGGNQIKQPPKLKRDVDANSAFLDNKHVEIVLNDGFKRPKALGIYDLERWKRVKLIQELTISTPSTLSTNRPGNDNEASARSLMDEALESCNKAWELQERHFGREHVATAAVHVSLAQVHLLRSINEDRASADEEKEAVHEAICCFTAAIDIYENACSGTVPASAFLRLELAKLYQQDQLKRDKARAEYDLVGRFFATFAAEFAGSESTKRECAALALDAFRQWITLSRNSTTSLDDQRFVLKEMNSVSVNGYGEFSIEACESAAQLARMLHRIATSRAGQREPQSEIYDKLRTATKLLRSATYIAESLLGANDRRSRKLRKDANEIESTMRSTLAGEQEDGGGHEWLTI
ncbi:hypothetical protein JG687_00001028 [Phytophthora cactorum]|uniref:Uncharacterized protein n=1 Tax=Phytophthora cactorum TaxID=29920 RepID=A0A8T1V136_9STRA|nr:hypothetical protein JG687_00001028 [Phytophthora cactorum]